MRSSRRKPYTERGISRVPCVKCGAPSEAQWRICATDMWTAVCRSCDEKINFQVANWAFGPARALELVRAYRGNDVGN